MHLGLEEWESLLNVQVLPWVTRPVVFLQELDVQGVILSTGWVWGNQSSCSESLIFTDSSVWPAVSVRWQIGMHIKSQILTLATIPSHIYIFFLLKREDVLQLAKALLSLHMRERSLDHLLFNIWNLRESLRKTQANGTKMSTLKQPLETGNLV